MFTCLKARTLSDSDSDSKPTVGGEAASEGTNERQQWPSLPERHE